MRALVLSGGGSFGSYQVGVLQHLLGSLQRSYDIVCGTSVGAINAAFLCMYRQGEEAGSIRDLSALWENVSTGAIYQPWPLIGCLAAPWKGSLYNSTPLHQLLDFGLDTQRLRSSGKSLSVGAVSLTTGRYKTWGEGDEDIKTAVKASSAFPLAFLPVRIRDEWWVDGGIWDNTPLHSALNKGAAYIDVILTFPIPRGIGKSPLGQQNGIFGKAAKLANSFMNGMFLDGFKLSRGYTINNRQAFLQDGLIKGIEEGGLGGGGYRYVNINVYHPGKFLGVNPLVFDTDKIKENILLGHQDAAQHRYRHMTVKMPIP